MQRVVRGFTVLWQRQTGEGLKIQQAGIPPPYRVLLLNAEQHMYFRPALVIDIGSKPVPGSLHPSNRVDAGVVFITELFPKRPAGMHGPVPGNVVKPKQPLIGAVPDILPLSARAGRILLE